jgi:predicted DNA-binding transcriptional regulator AlpA
MSTPKILRYPAVVEMTGINRSQIEDLVEKGEFCKPTKLIEGGRSVGFFADEVELYVEWRRSRRDGTTTETWKEWFAKRGRKAIA